MTIKLVPILLALGIPCGSLLAEERPKSKKKSLPAPLAKSIREITNLPYAATDNPRQKLDLFLPAKAAQERVPVIVYIHGGAWRQGDKRGGRRLLTPFVSSGRYAGVSVSYRLSQEATWPAQIHDCKAAIRWIRGNAGKYRLDPDKIAVWGTSAGGHLVAMLGVSSGVAPLEGSLGEYAKQSSRVTCVANFFGPSDLLSMDDFPSDIIHNAPDSPESQLVGGPIQELPEKSRNASPLTHVTMDDAPFLHVHGTLDPLVPFDQAQLLDAALDEVGVPSLLITMQAKGHGRFDNPQIDEILKKFFAKHLHGAPHELREQVLPPAPNPSRTALTFPLTAAPGVRHPKALKIQPYMTPSGIPPPPRARQVAAPLGKSFPRWPISVPARTAAIPGPADLCRSSSHRTSTRQ